MGFKKSNIKMLEIITDSADLLNTKDAEEMLFVIKGSGAIMMDGESHPVTLGESFHLPKNSIASIANIEEEILRIIAVKL